MERTVDPYPFIRDAHEHCSDANAEGDAEVARWHAAELTYLAACHAAGADEVASRAAWAAGIADYRRRWLKGDDAWHRPLGAPWPATAPARPPREPRPLPPTITLKVTPAVLRRLDALLPWAESQIDLGASGRVTRADVTRAALAIGIAELERRAKRDGG